MSQLDDQGINNNTQIKINNNNTETESISTNITTTSSSNSPTITPELTRKERQYIKQNQIPSVSATNSPTTSVANNNDSSGYRPTLQQTTRDRIRFTWPPTTSPAPTIQIVTDSPTTVKRWKKNNRDSAIEELKTDSPTESPIEKEEEEIKTKEIRESVSPTLQVTQANTKRRDRKKTNQLASNTTATVEPNSNEPDSREEEADTSQNNNNKQSQPTQYPTYLGTTYYPTLSWPTYTPTTFGERPNYIQKMISQREKKELARQHALEEAEQRLAAGELGSEGVGSSKSPSSSQVPTTNTHAYGVNNSVSRPLSHGGLGTELIPTPSPNGMPTKKEKKDEQQEEEDGYQGRGYQDAADSRTNHAFSRFDNTPQPTSKPIVNEEEVYLRFANDGLSCNNATKDECKLLTDKCAWDKQSGSCDEAVSVSPTESNPYDTSGRTWGSSSSGRGGSQPTGRYSTFDDTDSPTPSLEEVVEETYEGTSRWKPRTSSPTNEDTPLPSYSPTISPISTEIPSYSPTISPIVPIVEEVFERFVNPEPRVSSEDTEPAGLSLKFHIPEKEPQQTTKLSLTFQVPTSTGPTAHPITSNPTSDEPTYFVFPTFSPTVHVVDTPIPTLWPSYMPTVGRAKRDISDDGFIVPLPEEGTISTQEEKEELVYEKRMCQEYPNGIHPNSKKVDEPIVFMYGIQTTALTELR